MTMRAIKAGFVGFGEIITIGSFTFEKIRNRVKPQSIYTHTQPEVNHPLHRLTYHWPFIVEVGLVGVKAVPVITSCHRIPCPV